MIGSSGVRSYIEQSFWLRRLAARSGLWQSRFVREHPPARPVGAKLELLYACNLRCTFCYTDSPRHTVAGTLSLSDEDWERVAGEVLDLGVVEVVLTGGEPLMRADLAIGLAERFAAAGVGVTFNTNGWFLDDALADRLAAIPGLVVDVSIDGPSPQIHDKGRGVPGSWRRAIEAVDRLLARGVAHQVVSVVLPETVPRLDEHIELMRRLGVQSLRLTPVAEIGAAARLRGTHIPRQKLLDAIERHRKAHGRGMRIVAQYGNVGIVPIRDQTAPAALLVRPNGSVLSDSLQPFAYGNAARDGVATCWERIRTGWQDPRISEWASSISSAGKVRDAEVVPYLSDELDLSAEAPDGAPAKHLDAALPRMAEPKEDGLDPTGFVRSLALARRYRREAVRIGGGGRDTYARKLSDGRIVRINETAHSVLDALEHDDVAAVVDRLEQLYPGVGRERLEGDALDAVRAFAERGFIRPAMAPAGSRPVAVDATPDLPGAIPGVSAAD